MSVAPPSSSSSSESPRVNLSSGKSYYKPVKVNRPNRTKKDNCVCRVFTRIVRAIKGKKGKTKKKGTNKSALAKLRSRVSDLSNKTAKKISELRAAFSQQSEVTKKSIFRHSITTAAFSLSLVFQQVAEISAVSGKSMGDLGLGIVGLLFEVCNIAQMSVRLTSFLKLYAKSKRDPGSLSANEKLKLQDKLRLSNMVLVASEVLTSLTGALSHVFRIAGLFVPGLSTFVIGFTLLSSMLSTINAVTTLVKAFKDPEVSKKRLAVMALVVALNALATCAFLAQAILSVSPTPLSMVATFSFALLQFLYVALQVHGLKEKVEKDVSKSENKTSGNQPKPPKPPVPPRPASLSGNTSPTRPTSPSRTSRPQITRPSHPPPPVPT
ncbi:hypothetical protein [Candidatus Similichlamydia epinepheli]|uniref:hypothetical protein n=1 Tax=Candidatus Similichlamydia epinepheli TaxID=1903953 RepID=UPI000D36B043|nr:hypothetical protein [Candidatus Similichlamydia epinepheli]